MLTRPVLTSTASDGSSSARSPASLPTPGGSRSCHQLTYASQPWHRVVIGLLVGEMFDLESLAEDFAKDDVYEGFFSASPIPFSGSVGGPVNPTLIK